MNNQSTWKTLAREPADALRRAVLGLFRDRAFDRAAQLAFWAMLGFIPLLIATFAVFGRLVSRRVTFRRELLSYLERVAPSDGAFELVRSVLEEIQAAGSGSFSFGLLFAVWIGSAMVAQIQRAIDQAFGSSRQETWFRRLTAIPFSIVVLVPLVLATVLLFYGRLAGASMAEQLGLGDAFSTSFALLYWPVVLASAVLSFDLTMNSAPSMLRRRKQWISPGAVLALALWVAVSFGFARYLETVPTYSAFYGSLGAVIVLLLWFFLSGLALLVGIHLNVALLNGGDDETAEDAL